MASPKLAASFRSLFDDMRQAWSEAPAPDRVPIGEGRRADFANVEAVAVASSWMHRIIRTGQLALLAAARGFNVEASPLTRSMIEHTIAMAWLVDQRGIAFQVLVRGRGASFGKLKEAQDRGWRLPGDDVQALLEEAITLETDEETRTHDNMLRIKHQAEKYGLGKEYQAWLIETWHSHPSIVSAQPYYEADIHSQTVRLLPEPVDRSETEAAVVSVTHRALAIYNRLLPGEPLTTQLVDWANRFNELADLLRSEHGVA